jgi:hypothetical protein
VFVSDSLLAVLIGKKATIIKRHFYSTNIITTIISPFVERKRFTASAPTVKPVSSSTIIKGKDKNKDKNDDSGMGSEVHKLVGEHFDKTDAVVNHFSQRDVIEHIKNNDQENGGKSYVNKGSGVPGKPSAEHIGQNAYGQVQIKLVFYGFHSSPVFFESTTNDQLS